MLTFLRHGGLLGACEYVCVCGGVDGETTFAKVPTVRFKLVPPFPPSTPPPPPPATPIYIVIRRGLKWPNV